MLKKSDFSLFSQFPYRNKTQQFYEALYKAMEEGEINTAERMAAFLAQELLVLMKHRNQF
jgi:predicted chitinase